MELTGKCEIAFKDWMWEKWHISIEKFNEMHLSFRYGVYVDFFYSSISYYEFMQIFRDLVTDELRFNTNDLTEVRTKAIEKADELFNNGH